MLPNSNLNFEPWIFKQDSHRWWVPDKSQTRVSKIMAMQYESSKIFFHNYDTSYFTKWHETISFTIFFYHELQPKQVSEFAAPLNWPITGYTYQLRGCNTDAQGPDNLRAMQAMGKNRVLWNCKCMKDVTCLAPYKGMCGFAVGLFAELRSIGRLSLIRVKLVKHSLYAF